VLNIFRLMARLGPDQIAASSDGQTPLDRIVAEGVRGAPDIGVLATRTAQGKVAVLLWYYHDDDLPGPDAALQIRLRGLRAGAHSARVWRVDGSHGNAFAAWQAEGAPPKPTPAQIARLARAARLAPEAIGPLRATRDGSAIVNLRLPRQGVALLEIDGR
jgi:xylan 1,4-beta-xylosidase